MDYINRLDNYDGPEIAKIASASAKRLETEDSKTCTPKPYRDWGFMGFGLQGVQALGFGV